jgi:hypothetical protein
MPNLSTPATPMLPPSWKGSKKDGRTFQSRVLFAGLLTRENLSRALKPADWEVLSRYDALHDNTSLDGVPQIGGQR